jgi:hypothetical protein
MSWHMWESVGFYLIAFALSGLVHVANTGIDGDIDFLHRQGSRTELNRMDCNDDTRGSSNPSAPLASSLLHSPWDSSAWLPCYYMAGLALPG